MIHAERLLNTFLEYVQIDSESRHEAAFAAQLAADLTAAGCEVWFDESQARTGSDTGNLYAVLPATAAGEPLLLAAHMDTVSPGRGIHPSVADGVVRSDGSTILASDDKSGIAAIVEVLRILTENSLPHPELQMVFTVCEELGLDGAHALDLDRITAKKALVLDGCELGEIAIAAPGNYTLKAAVVGRTSHAGIAPERGVSALQVMAEAISHMRLLRIDEETTANIGSIRADGATNIVPERCEIQAEARSLDDEKLITQGQHMMTCLTCACEKYGASLEGGLIRAYSPYRYRKDDPFVLRVCEACRTVGIEPLPMESGGGSDANVLHAHGIRSLVIGTGMTNVHTVKESIAVRDLESVAALLLELTTVAQ